MGSLMASELMHTARCGRGQWWRDMIERSGNRITLLFFVMMQSNIPLMPWQRDEESESSLNT